MSSESLDEAFYRSAYPDLAHLSARGLKRHWRTQGIHENRFANGDQLGRAAMALGVDPSGFSAREYLALNPDLPLSLAQGEGALLHYVTQGHREGRAHALASVISEVRTAAIEEYVDEIVRPVATRDGQDVVALLHLAAKRRIPAASEIRELSEDVARDAATKPELLLTWLREELVAMQHPLEASLSIEHLEKQVPHPGADHRALRDALRLPSWFTTEQWMARYQVALADKSASPAGNALESGPGSPEESGGSSIPLVTVLVSVHRSDDFIDRFTCNLAEQDLIDRCEVSFVLVEPSPRERAAVEAFRETHPMTKVAEFQSRISIYEAWNFALRGSTAAFVTNANVDDTRRPDSLRLQYEFLADHPDIDVVYQDYFITLEPHLAWPLLAKINCRTDLPPVGLPESLDGLVTTHCAPMWRRALHSQVGFFDAALRSVGDNDFWLRCLLANRRFAKMNDVHVGYFFNPAGLSTAPGGSWEAEGERLRHIYWWQLRGVRRGSSC